MAMVSEATAFQKEQKSGSIVFKWHQHSIKDCYFTYCINKYSEMQTLKRLSF